MKRLTDEQIQEYLDGNLSAAEKTLVEKVLQESPEQRKRLNHYKSLSMALSEDPGFELSPNFAHNVMVNMQKDGAEKVLFKFSQVILWLVGIATAIAVTIHFTNFQPVLEKFKTIGNDSSGIFNTFIASFKAFFESINVNPAFIGMIIVVLGAIFLIDRAITRVRNTSTTTMLC